LGARTARVRFTAALRPRRQAKAITATARKIAILFYNGLRHGMDYVDPGASYYETRYRERVLKILSPRQGLPLRSASSNTLTAEQVVS